MIQIRSQKEGFRRCGVPHPREATLYPDDMFSKEELEILRAEPMLMVETGIKDSKVQDSEAKGAPKGNSGKPKKGK